MISIADSLFNLSKAKNSFFKEYSSYHMWAQISKLRKVFKVTNIFILHSLVLKLMNYLVPRRYHTIKLGPESRVELATKHYKCKFSSLLNDVSLKLYIDGVKSRKYMNSLIANYKHGFFSCRVILLIESGFICKVRGLSAFAWKSARA